MLYLIFSPGNSIAQQTFSTLICARRTTLQVLSDFDAVLKPRMRQRQADLAAAASRLEAQGSPVPPAALTAAAAQLRCAVDSRDGFISVRLPLSNQSEAAPIVEALLLAYRSASLGKGAWEIEIQSGDADWRITAQDRAYFSPRAALPVIACSADDPIEPGEVEDALRDAIYGAMVAAAVSAGVEPAAASKLFVQVEKSKTEKRTDDGQAIDAIALKFVANVDCADCRFVGIDSQDGFGLFVSAN